MRVPPTVASAGPDLSFETPGARARRLCEGDLDLYLALYADPVAMRHVGPVMERAAALAQFRRALALNGEGGGRVRYWAAHGAGRDEGMPLGLLSAARNRSDARAFEVGIMLLGHAQGRGHGRSLLSGLLDCVFAGLGGDGGVVTASHLARNLAARALFSGLGFSFPAGDDPIVQARVLTAAQWHRRTRPSPTSPSS